MSKKIRIDLRDRWASILSSYPKELKEELRYRDDNFFFKQRFSRWGHFGDGWKNMINRDRIPTGLFLATRNYIEKKLRIRFKVKDKRIPVKYHHKHFIKSERKYQNQCVDAMVQKPGGLVLMATGTGKTYIAGLYFSRLYGSAVFIVDELTLLYQAKEELEKVLGEKVGIVGESKFKPRRITVATIQTLDLHRNDKGYTSWSNNLDACILDEFHQVLNPRSTRTMNSLKPKNIYGFTATLNLKKKSVWMKAYAIAGEACYTFPISAGINEKVLSKGVAISVPIRQGDVKKRSWPSTYKKLIVESQKRNEKICDIVMDCYTQGKSIVVLVDRIAHLNIISEMLNSLEYVIPHRLVYGAKSVQERIRAKKDFQKKKLRVILTNKVFKKGINIPAINIIIDAAASKSKNDAVQKYGRGIRISEGKRGLIYFDISDRSKGEISRDDDTHNRFSAATGARLRALKAAGIKVVEIEEQSTTKLVEKAKKELQKVLHHKERKHEH